GARSSVSGRSVPGNHHRLNLSAFPRHDPNIVRLVESLRHGERQTAALQGRGQLVGGPRHALLLGYRWEQYRRWSWILAAVAVLDVVREFLPVPRLFGQDDD